MSKEILSNAQLEALVQNLTTSAPKTSFIVAEKTYPASQIVKLAESVLTARSNGAAAKGKWVDARNQAAQVEASNIPIVSAVRVMLVPMLSSNTSAMNDLAVAPRKKPTPLTPQDRLAATAKNRATRVARGTTGKKQKANVKGNVTGVVVTPVTSQGTTPVAPPASATTPTTTPVNNVIAAPASPAGLPTATAPIAAAAGGLATTGH
jgi:hypothetical protein